MTREEIRKLLEMAVECYPYIKDKIDGKQTLNLWEMTFGEYEATDVFKAVRYHINHSKWFPTPADIKQAIPKATMIYDDTPDTPQIEAPKGNELVDMSIYDNLIDTEPDDKCRKCPRLRYCYKTA